MLFDRYEASTREPRRRILASRIEPTRSHRKLFFRGFQVVRAKHRVYGKKLAPNQVLVKLRESGKSPTWVLLARDAVRSRKVFSRDPQPAIARVSTPTAINSVRAAAGYWPGSRLFCLANLTCDSLKGIFV